MTTAVTTEASRRAVADMSAIVADEWAREVLRVATVHADKLGREVIVIPDNVARYMRAEVKRGWREFPGVAAGESRPFAPGTRMYALTAAVIDVYAKSAVPREFAVMDAAQPLRHDSRVVKAERSRAAAAEYRQLYAFVVGWSGWDYLARWWADYDNTGDLHVPANPAPCERNGTAYRYHG